MTRTPHISVRSAFPEDAPTVAEIWRIGWADGHVGFVPDELVAVRDEKSFRIRAAERVGDTTVALVDDLVAGFVMVVGDELEQIYVSKSHRGTGVAGALLDEAERQVKEAGHATAWLAVVAGNKRARRFYERRGWRDEGPFDYAARSHRGPIIVPCRRYEKTL